jgi:hypothetical protein
VPPRAIPSGKNILPSGKNVAAAEVYGSEYIEIAIERSGVLRIVRKIIPHREPRFGVRTFLERELGGGRLRQQHNQQDEEQSVVHDVQVHGSAGEPVAPG